MMQTCPNCGEKWDSSGRYTSPANAAKDRIWWRDEHLSGACAAEPEPHVSGPSS